ncbi:uncharacterized protein METZ01_LOCUS101456 [marine metagenome]|uniref:Uncharacterized protein n=1 Tax=marine metagenome TaxID=408172 RepID=A0A381W813_9ZZZZ
MRFPEKGIGESSQSETFPPASFTMRPPAQTSQGASPNSQNPSKRPMATKQKSKAAAPSLRTP